MSLCGAENCCLCGIIAENALPPNQRKTITIMNHMGSDEVIEVKYNPSTGIVSKAEPPLLPDDYGTADEPFVLG